MVMSLSSSPLMAVVKLYVAGQGKDTVKLGNKERSDKEQIGIKEPFSVTNLPFTS